ncbi:hypothetical protein L226DRAFT_617323 [Lentinus tigrinus ALCF2SS1-7]|uniref:UvrD-like helicase ATP-binding domain-containing protein n=1 Tax=Lentinus tigrinus ALCF2SS1-6 TaxID=1328759 RepID=A0A5C2S6P7_9APHY|nr:hypothetical protein L227DRAFT_527336 [Lentinus tigrinus ALCF2SS1-6]RPD68764.1 hypothetical protein L226DRAFT_617323 [Lentinus tigrinus ALCF2SS1-7]
MATQRQGDVQSGVSTLEWSPLDRVLNDLQNAARMIYEMDERSFATLSEELTQSFPDDSQSFLNSVAAAVLSSLNIALAAIDWATDQSGKTHPKRSTDECWRAVVLARPVLTEIARLSKQNEWWKHADIVAKPFANIGIEAPSNAEELSHIEAAILQDQRDVLKCYLAWARLPDVAEHMKRNSGRSDEGDDQPSPDHSETYQHAPHTHTITTEIAADDVNDAIATYLPLRPPKSLFFLESAEGFGEWEIQITSSATTELRKLRRRSPVSFERTLATLRELSNGDFSSANHVLLSDTEGAVPIFKARVTDELRLVYCIDCIPDHEAEVDRQAIRVFGIYTHAQLKIRLNFWNNVAKDLGRQGEMYRDRCRRRSRPRNTGENIYTPLTFPMLPERASPEHSFLLPVLASEADAADIISMNRIVVLSKPLLHSFLADHEVPFMGQPSPLEMKIIEHDASCFVIGRSGTGKTWTMMYKIIAIMRGSELWNIERAKPRVMFVTRSSMLADQVHSMTSQLLEAFRLATLAEDELEGIGEQRAQSSTPASAQLGGKRRHGLPKRWSALEEKHFPLFVTVDELYSMLEADLFVGLRELDQGELDIDVGEDSLLSSVSGNRFVKTYWTHFPRSLTKGFDPMTVFSEFLGVIKGSETTVGTRGGYLDRQAYLALSTRSYPTFASNRAGVYDLFEAYLRLTRKRRERDSADRAHALLRRLDSSRLPGLPVDFLFADEVQDNLIVDMLLLRSLCNNPNGLFWAGDTAQTIAIGSSFTFNELTSMLHRLEERQANPMQVPPTTFYLSINYRSHSGIANCAQTVVDLLMTHWPDSLDRLGPEHGWRPGPRPVFFGSSGTDESTVFDRQYTRASPLTLGSEQCVIVRDEAAKEAFHSRGIFSGLVLTIYQSKGQEFDDVFLYHLFEDCPVSLQQWRTLCEPRMAGRGTVLWAENSRGFCRELKMFYVALTRARQRLWIVDGSGMASPMVELWTRRGVIEDKSGEDAPLSLVGQSSADDWAKRGKQFMDSREFSLAQQCFENADLPSESEIAKAYLLQETADGASAFSAAASAFGACAKKTSGEQAKKLFLASAACHYRARNFKASAEACCQAGEFSKCAELYRKARMMEEARQTVLCHRPDVSDVVFEKICMHFFDINERLKAIEMFTPKEEAIAFMKAHELYRALAPYLVDLGRVREAAEMYLNQLHDVPNAVELFFRDQKDVHMVEWGTRALLEELWCRLSFGCKVDLRSQHSELSKLLVLASCRLSESFSGKSGSEQAENELAVFVAIGKRDAEGLNDLGKKFSHLDKALAAISFDFAFTFLLQPREGRPLEPDRLTSFLSTFDDYAKILTDYQNKRIWKAYGLHEGSGKKPDSYVIPRFSYLYPAAIKDGESESVSPTTVKRLLGEVVGAHLRRRASNINAACRGLDSLRLCMLYAFTGHCSGMYGHSSCVSDHFPIANRPHPLNEHGFHARLRIHAQIIRIYEPLVCQDGSTSEEIWNARIFWIDSFLATIYFPFFERGNLLMFAPERVPEFKEACRVLRSWICGILFAAPYPRSTISGRVSGNLWIRAIPRASLLSYVLDRIDDHLLHATVHRQGTSTPPFLWYTASYSLVTDKLTKYVEREPSHSKMPGALLYLRFLLERGETHFHRGIMAHLAEGLCSAFILSDRVRKSLHKVIVNRRWLVNLADLWTASNEVQRHERCHVQELVEIYPVLLERLSVAEGGNSHRVTSDTLYFVCRALFHLGFWHSELTDKDEKSRILKILTGIPKDCPKPDYLYRILEQGRRPPWDALRNAINWSTPPHSRQWDQLVQLQVDTERLDSPGKVIQVTYSSSKDLLSLLLLPDKPYKSSCFPRGWLQERIPVPRPPSPAVCPQGDASQPETFPQSAYPPTPEAVEAVEAGESSVTRVVVAVEQDTALAEQHTAVDDAAVAEQDAAAVGQDAGVVEQDTTVAEQDVTVAE